MLGISFSAMVGKIMGGGRVKKGSWKEIYQNAISLPIYRIPYF